MSGEATFLKRWPPRFSMGGNCRILAGCVGWFRRPLACGGPSAALSRQAAQRRVATWRPRWGAFYGSGPEVSEHHRCSCCG